MRTKNALLNIIFNILLQVIVIVYGFLIPKIIIIHYGSNVNGLITSIAQFLGYISLLQAGFGPVVKSLLYKPIAKKNYEEISNILKTSEYFFKKIAKIFVVYIIFLSFLYPLIINNDFSFIYTFSLIIIISVSIFSEYYFGMTYTLFLQSDQKTYVICIIQIITYLLSLVLIYILAYFNMPIHLLKLLSAIIFVFRPILQNFYVKKKYKIDLKNANNKYEIKNKYEGLAQHIAFTIHQSTDITLLTFFRSLEEISVYGVYKMITTGIESLVYAITNGISASFGDMIAKDELINLKEKYDLFETLFIFFLSILYSCTLILIIPFVKVYTINITDANYINYAFGYLAVLSSLLYCFRSPYNELTKNAGMFKETRKFAIIEAIVNITISIALIGKYGLVGIAIGTLIAMFIRTIDLVNKSNKYIIKRSNIATIKKVVIMTFDIIALVIISVYVPMISNNSFINWTFNSCIIFLISVLLNVFFFGLFFFKDFTIAYKIMLGLIKKKK